MRISLKATFAFAVALLGAAPAASLFQAPGPPWQSVRTTIVANIANARVLSSYEHIDAGGNRHAISFASLPSAGMTSSDVNAFLAMSLRHTFPGLILTKDEDASACGHQAHYVETNVIFMTVRREHLAMFWSDNGSTTFIASYGREPDAKDDASALRAIRSLCPPTAVPVAIVPAGLSPPPTFVRIPNMGQQHEWMRESGNGFSFMVENSTHLSQAKTSAEYGKSETDRIKSGQTIFTLLSSGPATMCGQPGWLMKTRATLNGKDSAISQATLMLGTRLYSAGYMRPAVDIDDPDAEAAILAACAPPEPSPTPTPTPFCNLEATISNPAMPQYPDAARKLKLGPVTALVQVTVNADGTLKSATIYKSSGNADIDAAAIDAAKRSTYAPRRVQCKPTEGTYLFRSDFNPD